MKQASNKSYWPHMIVGFLFIGIVLAVWTVKTVAHFPVSQENRYMMTYQQVETDYATILKKEKNFDARYRIAPVGLSVRRIKVQHSKAKRYEDAALLVRGSNHFAYRITDKSGNPVTDMNVTFLLTRPHTVSDDVTVANVKYHDGGYRIDEVNVTKPGRYILRLRAQKGDAVKYLDIPAYLAP